jgi:hypothetical protein
VDSVIPAEEIFKERRAVVQFARMSRLVKARDRALRDDPKKFLDAAGLEIVRLRRVIEAAYEVLHPSLSSIQEPSVMPPRLPADDSMRRCADAGDILWRGMA